VKRIAGVLSKPFVVNESQCEVEAWNDSIRGTVRWRTLLSSDRTPTDSLTMGVAELRANDDVAFKLHRHHQAESYYILSGRGVVSINATEHALAPGDAVFIPGGAPHGARCVGAEPLRLLYIFAADRFDQVQYEFLSSADVPPKP
jgi:quercetin dioxygenase-like cupin family protein